MAQYLLLLHDDPANFEQLSPEEMQKVIEEYSAWSRKMAEAGHLVDGKKLADEPGRHLRKNEEGLVVDGPFSESKEVIGGFFLIQADDYDHAAKLCGDCPHLAYGGRIEVREIDSMGEEEGAG